MAAPSPRMISGTVAFAVPVEVAFAYLADPRNRPEWQSSLRRVEMLDDGMPRVGMRWRDHTAARIVPEMEITALEPPEAWAEEGRWRGLRATLMLTFRPTDGGCEVDVAFRVTGRGPLWAMGWLVTLVGVWPVRSDVRRSARLLEQRAA